jgi:O-6-methylguanine DNA methyltransferase
MVLLRIPTPDGEFLAGYSDVGLCSLIFPDSHSGEPPSSGACVVPARSSVDSWHQLTSRALHLALTGQPFHDLPPLDLRAGTEFQQLVWQALRRIPRTWTYGQVAEAIGRPKALRAVGAACGANPIPVLIPCHRVLAAHGIGGFSGGLHWKRLLLSREGVLGFEGTRSQQLLSFSER